MHRISLYAPALWKSRVASSEYDWRGHKSSTVCAIKLEKKLDSGPIYLKKKI